MEARFRFRYLLSAALLGGLVLFSTSGYAKTGSRMAPDLDVRQYHEFVHQFPEPESGFGEITSKIAYPKIALYTHTEGEVLAKAFIDEKGYVQDVEIVKGIGAGCDEAVAKAVEETRFKPAIFEGKAVKSQVVIPFKFKMDSK